MTLKDELTLALTTIATVIGLLTLLKGIIEYRKSTITKRLELFLTMRSRLREDLEFKNICQLLEADDPRLRDIPLVQKDRFTGFFEELAIIRNSRLINDDVILYMFGYFAIRCNQSENFWFGLYRNQPLWSLFFSFADDMEKASRNFKFVKERYHVA